MYTRYEFKTARGGYRIIYYVQTAESLILVTIYAKVDQANIGNDEIRRIIEEYRQDKGDG
ncbi:MAG: hypothetical protein SF029_26155 [bacterium]|nr:hypothetical protein [bacterium]